MDVNYKHLTSWIKKPIFWIVFTGLVLRLGSVAINYHQMRWQNEPRMAIPAVRLLEGKGISLEDGIGQSAYRPPLYILWLAGAYAIFGKFSLIGPSLLQTLASTANILLLFLLAKQIWKRDDTANASALLLAIHPYSVYHDTQLYHTFLSTALIFGGLIFLLRGLGTQRRRDLFLSGALFGLLILVISTVAPFLGLIIVIGLIFWKIPFKKKLVLTVFFVLGMATTWGPWIIRNAFVFKHFVPVTTEYGVTLYETNNPEASERLKARTHEDTPVPKGTKFNLPSYYGGCVLEGWCESGVSEYEESKELTIMGMDWIKKHPYKFVNLTIWRFSGIWSPFLTPEKHFGPTWWTNATVNWGYTLWNFSLAFFTILGLQQAWKEKKLTYPILAVSLALSSTAVYSIFNYFTKYRIPFEAALLPLAGAGLTIVWQKVKPFLLKRSSYRAD